MNPKFRYVALGLTLVGLASCSNEAPWATGGKNKGDISLQLSADADVKDVLPIVRSGVPELLAPDVESFAIEMRNLDTDLVQTWPSLEKFNSEEGFDVGSYTLTAFYGNIEECGFDKPYFKGEANVTVLEGRESNVDVTAQLANVMLSIEYTEAFRNYFRDYRVTAHTDGHANVVFGRSETRAGFLAPGDITLQVSLTNPSGKTATITPAHFPAQARHHYHVKFDVNADPIEGVTLEVIFDDSLTQENVNFTLSDELYNAEVPIVSAEGFSNKVTVEALSGNPAPAPLKFEAICKGGIKSAVLKIAQIDGSEWTPNPSFNTELDLIQADESTQNALEKNGIKVAGLFKNPQQMAIVDVTNLPQYLPEGTFEITFTVTDILGRNNETPVTLNLSTLPINLVVNGGSALYEYPGNAVTTKPTVDATVKVTYNGLNPGECISFKNKCRTGMFKDCEIVGVQESTATRGFPDKTYIFNIKVCDVETSPLPMQLWFNGKEKAKFDLNIIEPQFSLEADAFATFARFKVNAENAEDIPTIVNGLTLYKDGEIVDDLYKDGKAIDKSLVPTDPEKGYLTISGLDSNTDYTIGYSLTSRSNGIPKSHTCTFTTEEAKDLPNYNFSETVNDINMPEVQVGGLYTGVAGTGPLTAKYHYSSSIVRDMPEKWTSINAKTCWSGASNKNTWFCVPSTYADNGKVVIRSVGYNHNGITPDTYGKTTVYYNPNAPTFGDNNKIAGELFLGSYSYDGSEHRSEGFGFGSRPMSVSFDYSYEPLNNEKAKAEFIVCDAGGKSIASAVTELGATNGITKTKTLNFNGYSEFGVEAASIKVRFISSTAAIPTINIPSGSALDEYHQNNISNGLRNNTLPANTYHAVATGSVLTIDNVKLNY